MQIVSVDTADAPDTAAAIAAALADIQAIADEQDDPGLIARIERITLRHGYWCSPSEHQDGRLVYHQSEPDWWWNRDSVPEAHHGWAYQTDLYPGPDYWTTLPLVE